MKRKTLLLIFLLSLLIATCTKVESDLSRRSGDKIYRVILIKDGTQVDVKTAR